MSESKRDRDRAIFPAYAGMSPIHFFTEFAPLHFPRVCGGDLQSCHNRIKRYAEKYNQWLCRRLTPLYLRDHLRQHPFTLLLAVRVDGMDIPCPVRVPW